MAQLQSSCDGALKKIEDFTVRVDAVESRLSLLESSLAATPDHKAQMDLLQRKDLAREQWSRLNNIEIKGVPMKKNENLFMILDQIGTAINYKVLKNQINFISRIPALNSREKYIVVSFLNRYVKEDFIASARAMKTLSSQDLGFSDVQQRIFVNDHLSSEYKKLLTKTKQTAKDKGFQYVWVKFSKIHIRKHDTSHTFIINSPADLNKLD